MQVLHEQVTITDVTGSSNNIGTVFVPKSVLFTTWESKQLDRGASRVAVNVENSLIAVGWNDNKAINFISTADSTEIVSVKRRIKNEKVEIPAPLVIKNYNMYMGGVDKHDKLLSTFLLGKHSRNTTSNTCCFW